MSDVRFDVVFGVVEVFLGVFVGDEWLVVFVDVGGD